MNKIRITATFEPLRLAEILAAIVDAAEDFKIETVEGAAVPPAKPYRENRGLKGKSGEVIMDAVADGRLRLPFHGSDVGPILEKAGYAASTGSGALKRCVEAGLLHRMPNFRFTVPPEAGE